MWYRDPLRAALGAAQSLIPDDHDASGSPSPCRGSEESSSRLLGVPPREVRDPRLQKPRRSATQTIEETVVDLCDAVDASEPIDLLIRAVQTGEPPPRGFWPVSTGVPGSDTATCYATSWATSPRAPNPCWGCTTSEISSAPSRDCEAHAALLEDDVTLRYGWPDVTERPCRVAFRSVCRSAHPWLARLPVRCPRCVQATSASRPSVRI